MTPKQAEEKAHELRLSAQLLALEGHDDQATKLYEKANWLDDSFNAEFEQVDNFVQRNGKLCLVCESFSRESSKANAGMLLVYLQQGKLNADEILAKFPDGMLNESQWWSVIEPVLNVVKKECEVKI